MGSSDFVSVETFSDGPSIWLDPPRRREGVLLGGTSVERLAFNARLTKPFSASSTDGDSSIEVVDGEIGQHELPLNKAQIITLNQVCQILWKIGGVLTQPSRPGAL